MTRPRSRLAVAAVVLAATAGALRASISLRSEEGRSRCSLVTADVRDRALAAGVPSRPSMSDEIRYFAARAEARPTETFAKLKLLQASLLAFRAYGSPEHLVRADEMLAALGPDASATPSGLSARATVDLTLHRFGAALEAARQLERQAPGEEATYRLFDALWAVGDREAAGHLLERPLDTLSTAYLSRRARVLDAEGLVEAARDLFGKVVQSTMAYAQPAPVRAWALIELGNFEVHSGRPSAGVARYREALEILPGSPAALEGLASVAYRVDGNLETARALYRRALANGAGAGVLPTLADVVEGLGRPAEAASLRDDFVQRATVDARSENLHRRWLIFVLAERADRLDEALRLARKEVRLRWDPGAWDALAWVHYRRGETTRAWMYAARAVEDGVPPPRVAWRAGIVAAAAGERARARELLRRALAGRAELNPEQADKASGLLAALRRPGISAVS